MISLLDWLTDVTRALIVSVASHVGRAQDLDVPIAFVPTVPRREARCENLIENPDLTATPCDGRLWFTPGDIEAPCDTCGARCGYLVADYVVPRDTPADVAVVLARFGPELHRWADEVQTCADSELAELVEGWGE